MSNLGLRKVGKIECPACKFKLDRKLYVIHPAMVTFNFLSSMRPAKDYYPVKAKKVFMLDKNKKVLSDTVDGYGWSNDYTEDSIKALDLLEKSVTALICPNCYAVLPDKKKIFDALRQLRVLQKLEGGTLYS